MRIGPISALMIVGLACSGVAAGADQPAPARHPNLLLNQQEIDQIKQKIKTQPWAAELLEKLKAGADGVFMDRHDAAQRRAVVRPDRRETLCRRRAAAPRRRGPLCNPAVRKSRSEGRAGIRRMESVGGQRLGLRPDLRHLLGRRAGVGRAVAPHGLQDRHRGIEDLYDHAQPGLRQTLQRGPGGLLPGRQGTDRVGAARLRREPRAATRRLLPGDGQHDQGRRISGARRRSTPCTTTSTACWPWPRRPCTTTAPTCTATSRNRAAARSGASSTATCAWPTRVERTGIGRGSIRMATYGDGSTSFSPDGTLFETYLVNRSAPVVRRSPVSPASWRSPTSATRTRPTHGCSASTRSATPTSPTAARPGAIRP